LRHFAARDGPPEIRALADPDQLPGDPRGPQVWYGRCCQGVENAARGWGQDVATSITLICASPHRLAA
jgi:hypothetical protein